MWRTGLRRHLEAAKTKLTVPQWTVSLLEGDGGGRISKRVPESGAWSENRTFTATLDCLDVFSLPHVIVTTQSSLIPAERQHSAR